MAQNVAIAGASYTGVPSINVPITGGGTATFVDSSDANAAATDIVQGKTAYVNGSKVTGSYTPAPSAEFKKYRIDIYGGRHGDDNEMTFYVGTTETNFPTTLAELVRFLNNALPHSRRKNVIMNSFNYYEYRGDASDYWVTYEDDDMSVASTWWYYYDSDDYDIRHDTIYIDRGVDHFIFEEIG